MLKKTYFFTRKNKNFSSIHSKKKLLSFLHMYNHTCIKKKVKVSLEIISGLYMVGYYIAKLNKPDKRIVDDIEFFFISFII